MIDQLLEVERLARLSAAVWETPLLRIAAGVECGAEDGVIGLPDVYLERMYHGRHVDITDDVRELRLALVALDLAREREKERHAAAAEPIAETRTRGAA